MPISHLLVIHFQATCESGKVNQNFTPEIIEFSIVVVEVITLQTVADFHRYVMIRIVSIWTVARFTFQNVVSPVPKQIHKADQKPHINKSVHTRHWHSTGELLLSALLCNFYVWCVDQNHLHSIFCISVLP